MSDKPILCLDFDGVIHDYKEGWKGGEIYGDVTPGFFDWAEEAIKHFQVTIYSSRSKTEAGRAVMIEWLATKWAEWNEKQDRRREGSILMAFDFAHEKPPAFLTIDDRAIQFEGRWDWLRSEILRDFKPWNQKRGRM